MNYLKKMKIISDIFECLFYKRVYKWRKKFRNCVVQYPIRYFDGEQHITADENLFLQKYIFLAAFSTYGGKKYHPQICFGKNVYINFNCQITATNNIIISDDVLIGSNVTITDHLHGNPNCIDKSPPKQRELYSKGDIFIGNKCLIGSGAVILPGVTLGEGCIIGANAVITKSFPPHTVIAGNPAIALKSLK